MAMDKKLFIIPLFLFIVSYVYCEDTSNLFRVKTIPCKINDPQVLRSGYRDNIELIGWSRTGLLAYRYITMDAGIHYCFVILNTITDEIIEKDSFNENYVNEKERIDAYKRK